MFFALGKGGGQQNKSVWPLSNPVFIHNIRCRPSFTHWCTLNSYLNRSHNKAFVFCSSLACESPVFCLEEPLSMFFSVLFTRQAIGEAMWVLRISLWQESFIFLQEFWLLKCFLEQRPQASSQAEARVLTFSHSSQPLCFMEGNFISVFFL